MSAIVIYPRLVVGTKRTKSALALTPNYAIAGCP